MALIFRVAHAELSFVSESRKSESFYRADIDGLRALAVIAVVAYHAGIPGFQGGFVGVDIFFAISGFLITRLLVQEWQSTGRIAFLDFYARRVRRLMPALWLVLAVSALLSWIWIPGMGNTKNFSASLRWAALGFANVFFKKNTGGYFDGATAEMPLLHLWSLGVEEQFYLLWPALLAALLWLQRPKHAPLKASGPSAGNPLTIRPIQFQWILGFLILTGLISFLGTEFALTHGKNSAAFYLMPYRAWELGVGAFFALKAGSKVQTQVGQKDSEKRDAWLSALALGVLGGSVAMTQESGHFPGSAALLPVLGTVLLLWLGEKKRPSFIARILSHPSLCRLGRVSYGWYLWHWPLFVFARIWNWGAEPALGVRLVCIGASYGLAELSLKYWEDPIRLRRWGRTISQKGWVTLGIASTAFWAGVSFSVLPIESRLLDFRLGKDRAAQVSEKTSFEGRCFRLEEVGAPHCTQDFSRSSDFDQSSPGAPTTEIAVWGDSHSCSAYPMIEALARDHRISATQYCLGQSLPLVAGESLDLGSYSGRVIQDLQSRIRQNPSRKVSVILAARWVSYLGVRPLSRSTARFPSLSDTPEASAEVLRIRLKATLDRLRAVGVARVVLLLPSPEFRASTVRCLLHPLEPCEVSRSDQEAYRDLAVRSLLRAAEARKDVRWIDPVDVQCSRDRCPQVLEDGTTLVSDENHPTPAAARRLGLLSRDTLNWLVFEEKLK